MVGVAEAVGVKAKEEKAAAVMAGGKVEAEKVAEGEAVAMVAEDL